MQLDAEVQPHEAIAAIGFVAALDNGYGADPESQRNDVHEKFSHFCAGVQQCADISLPRESESQLDIGSALQGLFTISVGSLLGISALHLHIRTGDHINIAGDGNIATIVKANLFPHGVPVPGFLFKLCLFALCAAAIALPSVSPLLVKESVWIGWTMVPLAFLGLFICERKTHAIIYFLANLLISWLVIRNNGFMEFTAAHGPQLRPLLDQLFDQSPGSLLEFLADYGPAIMAELFSVVSLCAFVMLQIWIGAAFLLTDAGTTNNAVQLGFYSVVTAFALVCVVSGSWAAMQAPWLIWPEATRPDPMNLINYGYAIFAHTFRFS